MKQNSTPGTENGEEDLTDQILSRLFDTLRILRRYWWMLLVSCAITIIGGYYWTLQQPRVYDASAKIVFYTPQNVFGNSIDQVDLFDPGGVWQFKTFWNTQKQILQSKEFLGRVVDQVDLVENENFMGKDVKKLLEKVAPENQAQELRQFAITKLRKSTTVDQMRESRVGVIRVEANDRQLTADLTNAIADAYILYASEVQSGGLNQMVSWFSSYVSNKESELTQAQTTLYEFKRDNEIFSVSFEDRRNLTGSNLELVNGTLQEITTRLSQENNLMHEAEKQVSSGAGTEELGELFSSPVITNAIQRKQQLIEKLEQLKAQGFLDKYPEVVALEKGAEVTRNNIRSEIDRQMAAQRILVRTLESQKRDLDARLAKLRTEAIRLDHLGVKYHQLKDRADNLKGLYETVVARSEELDLNTLYDSSNVRILDRAQVPKTPIRPRLFINLFVSILLGLVLGTVLLLISDLLDQTIKRREDITRYCDRPLLGTLPAVEPSLLKGIQKIGIAAIDTIVHTAPKSSFAEGLKSLRTNLMFMSGDTPPRVFLISSPGPGEGKTVITANMGIAMAQSGLRTVIVDGDMRRPRLHKTLNIPNQSGHGVTHALDNISETVSLAQETEIRNLFILPCGKIPHDPTELLHSDRFQDFVEELRQNFDRVIIDSPPIGAVTDALIISQFVDAALLILKHGKTRREMFRRSVDQLLHLGAPLAGFVLNEITKEAGGYGYSYYYYYRYNYGQNEEQGGKKKLAS